MADYMEWRQKYQKSVDITVWNIIGEGLSRYVKRNYFLSVDKPLSLDLDKFLCSDLVVWGYLSIQNTYLVTSYKFDIKELCEKIADGSVTPANGADSFDSYLADCMRISDFKLLKNASKETMSVIPKRDTLNRVLMFIYTGREIDKKLNGTELYDFYTKFERNVGDMVIKEKNNEEFIREFEAFIKLTESKGICMDAGDLMKFTVDFIQGERLLEKEEKAKKTQDSKDFVKFSSYFSNFQKDILKKVIGQDVAVRKFVQGYFEGKMRDTKQLDGPESRFLFVGPPGIGKTYLAQVAADLSGRVSKVFYMSEYAHEESFNGLVGFEKTWKNSKPGALTDFVKNNPDAILIFDEVEKAHVNTIHLFLSILEGGKLRDLYTEEDVDFTSTIVIFTTNAGRDFFEDKRDLQLSSLSEETLVDALRNDLNERGNPKMPPEILSRLRKGNIIGFDYLDPVKLVPIIKKGLDSGAEVIKEQLGFDCEFDSSLFPYLFLYHMGATLDARVAAARSENFIKEAVFGVAERVGDDFKAFRKVTKDKSRTVLRLEISEEELVDELTQMKEVANVLVICNSADRAKFKTNDKMVKMYYVYADNEKSDYKNYILQQLEDHNINAILVDPFMREYRKNTVDQLEGLGHKNTRGKRILDWILSMEEHPSVYCMELNRLRISLVDRQSLMENGVRGILEFSGRMKPEERVKAIYNVCYEEYLSGKLKTMYSRGNRLNFEIGYRMDEDGEEAAITIRILDFVLERSMDSEAREIFLDDVPENRDSFDNVVGGENAKEELRRFIRFLKDPEEYKKTGQQISKGILLYGPPGSGKTKLARALAFEAGCPFISATGTEFAKGDKRVADIFRLARKYAPSIIFIDEIETFAMDPKVGGQYPSIVKELMTEMDGFSKSNRPVFVIAATNAADAPHLGERNIYLDEGLLRRFTKKVYMKWPNREERKQFLKIKQEELKNKAFNLNRLSEEDMEEFADLTAGHSLAEMADVIELAIGKCADSGIPVTMDILSNCFEESVYGEERKYSREHIYTTALHEAGHAFMGFFCDDFKMGRFTPEYATIIARGGYLGLVRQRYDETRTGYSKEELIKVLRIKLAGRAAEVVFADDAQDGLTTGASNDLEVATDIVSDILTTYGMEEGFLAVIPMETIMKSSLAKEYVDKINGILIREMTYTQDVIRQNQDKVRALADAMIDRSRLDTEDMARIIGIEMPGKEEKEESLATGKESGKTSAKESTKAAGKRKTTGKKSTKTAGRKNSKTVRKTGSKTTGKSGRTGKNG